MEDSELNGTCEVCGQGINYVGSPLLSAEDLRTCLGKGFAVGDVDIEDLIGKGYGRSEAIEALVQELGGHEEDYFLCTGCYLRAEDTLLKPVPFRPTKTGEFVDVSETAVNTGFGIFGCPVAVDKSVWNDCVQWTDQDNETQGYQDEDARLWDILFAGGAKLQFEPNAILQKESIGFEIYCIPRDGRSQEAVPMNFKIEKAMLLGTHGLIVRKADAIRKEG